MFQISDAGSPTDDGFADSPSLAFNGLDNGEYLVVWRGDELNGRGTEIYGQRLAAGALLGDGFESGSTVMSSAMMP